MKNKLIAFFSYIMGLKNYIFSFILGLSLVFSYAPFSLWWLPFVVLPLWFYRLENTSPKEAAKQGYAFALGWFSSGISWIHVCIDQFGGVPLIASIFIMLLLCAYLALYSALACYLSAKFTTKKQLNLWLLPSFWCIAEYCRAHFLTGFPWLSLGYSQIDSPLAHWAPIIGEMGITYLLLLISVLIFNLINRSHTKKISISIIILSLLTWQISNVNWVTGSGEITKVALIQGNISQDIKWSPEQEWPTLLTYIDLTRINYDADIIVWPESAIPALESAEHIQDYLAMANQSAHLNQSAIITGILNYDIYSQDYYNALIVLGDEHKNAPQAGYKYNNANRYYKNHLLPIGEFVPFQEWLRPIAPLFNLPMSSFSRGDYIQPNLKANGINILPLICFEIAFPEQLNANFTLDTNILLTVSNDTWFGDSHGPHQHLEIARMRAIEFGRPLIRATNTGITAVIDYKGKIKKIVPQFKQAVLASDIEIMKGQTPFSQWGLALNMLITLITLLLGFFLKKQ